MLALRCFSRIYTLNVAALELLTHVNRIDGKAATTLQEAESRAVSPPATSLPPPAVLGSLTR